MHLASRPAEPASGPKADASVNATIAVLAGVAELADARDSKSRVLRDVWVRPPPPAYGLARRSGNLPVPRAPSIGPLRGQGASRLMRDWRRAPRSSHGWRRRPGLNPCIKAVVNRVDADGHEVLGIRRGLGRAPELRPRRSRCRRSTWSRARPGIRPHDRPDRRNRSSTPRARTPVRCEGPACHLSSRIG